MSANYMKRMMVLSWLNDCVNPQITSTTPISWSYVALGGNETIAMSELFILTESVETDYTCSSTTNDGTNPLSLYPNDYDISISLSEAYSGTVVVTCSLTDESAVTASYAMILEIVYATISQVTDFVNENVETSPGELKFTKPYSYIGNDIDEASEHYNSDPINYIALVNHSEPIQNATIWTASSANSDTEEISDHQFNYAQNNVQDESITVNWESITSPDNTCTIFQGFEKKTQINFQLDNYYLIDKIRFLNTNSDDKYQQMENSYAIAKMRLFDRDGIAPWPEQVLRLCDQQSDALEKGEWFEYDCQQRWVTDQIQITTYNVNYDYIVFCGVQIQGIPIKSSITLSPELVIKNETIDSGVYLNSGFQDDDSLLIIDQDPEYDFNHQFSFYFSTKTAIDYWSNSSTKQDYSGFLMTNIFTILVLYCKITESEPNPQQTVLNGIETAFFQLPKFEVDNCIEPLTYRVGYMVDEEFIEAEDLSIGDLEDTSTLPNKFEATTVDETLGTILIFPEDYSTPQYFSDLYIQVQVEVQVGDIQFIQQEIGPFLLILEEEELILPFPPMFMSTPSYEFEYETNQTTTVFGGTPVIFDANDDFCEIQFESDHFGQTSFSNCSGSDEYQNDETMLFSFDESFNTGLLFWFLKSNVTYLEEVYIINVILKDQEENESNYEINLKLIPVEVEQEEAESEEQGEAEESSQEDPGGEQENSDQSQEELEQDQEETSDFVFDYDWTDRDATQEGEEEEQEEKIQLEIESIKLDSFNNLETVFNQEIYWPLEQSDRQKLISSIISLTAISATDSDHDFVGTLGEDQNSQLRVLEENVSSDLEFYYYVKASEGNKFVLGLEFVHKGKVSQSPYGQDWVEFALVNEDYYMKYIIGKESGEGLISSSMVEKTIDLNPVIEQSEEEVKEQEKQMQSASYTTFGVSFVVIILACLLNRGMQDIWGMINTQQLSIMLGLVSVMNLPSNAFLFRTQLQDLNTKEMYPTDQIFGWIFSFTITDPMNSQYEASGFESMNFILNSGALLINLVSTFLAQAFLYTTNRVCARYHENPTARYIGTMLPKNGSFAPIVNQLFIVDCLNLMLCITISFSLMKWNSEKIQTTSDKIQIVFAIIIAIVLLAIPILKILYIFEAKKHHREYMETLNIEEICQGNERVRGVICNQKDLEHLEKKKKKELQKLLRAIEFEDRKVSLAYYELFFIVRRFCFIMVLVLFANHPVIQLILLSKVGLLYIMFLAASMPFEQKAQNYMQILNEVCVMLITYTYMFFKQSFEPNEYIGKAFKSIYIMNFAFNLLKVMLFLTLSVFPELYRKYQQRKDAYSKIVNPRLEYFDKILKMHIENQRCPIALAYYTESLKIFKEEKEIITSEIYCLNLRNQQNMGKLIVKRQIEYQEKITWLLKNGKSLEHLNQDQPEQISKITQQQGEGPRIQKAYKLPKLQIEMDKDYKIKNLYPHNIITENSDQLPPYDQYKYLKIYDNLSDGQDYNLLNLLNPQKAFKIRTKIKYAKVKSLINNLHDQKFLMHRIECGCQAWAKAISLMVYGTEKEFMRVRKELYDQALKKYEEKYKQMGLKEDKIAIQISKFEKKLNPYLKYARFLQFHIHVAARLYKTPIIVLSSSNNKAFFDFAYEVKNQSAYKQNPLYVVIEKNFFAVAVHRRQGELIKFFQTKRIIFKPIEDKKAILEEICPQEESSSSSSQEESESHRKSSEASDQQPIKKSNFIEAKVKNSNVQAKIGVNHQSHVPKVNDIELNIFQGKKLQQQLKKQSNMPEEEEKFQGFESVTGGINSNESQNLNDKDVDEYFEKLDLNYEYKDHGVIKKKIIGQPEKILKKSPAAVKKFVPMKGRRENFLKKGFAAQKTRTQITEMNLNKVEELKQQQIIRSKITQKKENHGIYQAKELQNVEESKEKSRDFKEQKSSVSSTSSEPLSSSSSPQSSGSSSSRNSSSSSSSKSSSKSSEEKVERKDKKVEDGIDSVIHDAQQYLNETGQETNMKND